MLQMDAALEVGPGREAAMTARPLRLVTVCAQHALVGEAVRVALAGSGLSARTLSWEELLDATASGSVATPALLLCELDPGPERRAAVAAVRALRGGCVVLTDSPPGPSWGAVLAAGAASVLPSGTDVEAVVTEVAAVAGGLATFDEDRRRELEAAWASYGQDQDRRRVRVERLSPRERSVLEQLHQGRSVTSIAEAFGVAESTVRSQVRRLFAKLEVRSQLAAVAVYAGYVVDVGD